ncbi:MAG: tripartite tricarboxylate transporter TctB family protein [Chloroflexota bacterium]
MNQLKAIKGSSYFLMVVLLVMIATIVDSLGFKTLSAKLLPLMFAGFITLLGTVQLFREMRGGGAPEKVQVDEDTGLDAAEPSGWGGYLVHGAWIVGFALAIYLIGFLAVIPLFTLAYMKFQGTRWLTSVITAVVLTAVIYGLFDILLQIRLYEGRLFTWLGF